MSILLKIYYFITFIFMFVPCFVIYIKSGSNGNVSVHLVLSVILYLVLIITNKKKLENFIFRIIQLPILKYYLLFLSFVTLTTLIHMIVGTYIAETSFYIVRMYKFYYACILVYIFPSIAFLFNIKLKTIIKLLYSIFYGILVVAFIQYLSFISHLNFISSFIEIFNNGRYALYADVAGCKETYRAYAFFPEPSALGIFIFIIMPFIYNITKTKFKLYKSNVTNYVVKKTFLPLMVLVLIFTKSPIYLILCFAELFILLIMDNIKNIKNNILKIIIFLSILTLLSSSIFYTMPDILETSYLRRISSTIECMGDFSKLVKKEGSLATRIVSYHIQWKAFTKNILFGCGLFNVEVEINPYYLKECLTPITFENYYMQYLQRPYLAGVNRSLFWSSLAEFGIIGTLLYLLFIVKNYIFAKRIIKVFSGIEQVALGSAIQSVISIYIISFYNLYYSSTIWLIYGFFVLYFYTAHYTLQRKEKND